MGKKPDRIVTGEGEFIIVDDDSQDIDSNNEPSPIRDLVRTERERRSLSRSRQVHGVLPRAIWGWEAF